MAFVNLVDVRSAEAILAGWLAGKLPRARNVTVVDIESPGVTGRSSETIMFTARWTEDGTDRSERLVARVQPGGEQALFPRYDLATEYQVMKALGEHTPVPVPRMRWLETDPSVLGAPFLVMDRAEGRVPPDDPPFPFGGWVVDLPVPEQALLYDNGLKALAAIHLVDPDALGLGILRDPARGMGGLDQQIPFFENYFQSARNGEPNPIVEATFEWVRANRPADEEPLVLSWGDPRPGNIVYAADHSVAAVLDWELAGLGAPGLDVGWWLVLDWLHTEGVGAPKVPGFPQPAAMVARYEELTGYVVRDLHFYQVFAALRAAVMFVRIANMMASAGLVPSGTAMALSNPSTHLLAKLLGLPAPQGPVQRAV